jgi:DNA repair protein RadC
VAAMNFPGWTRVAEVELVYKTKIKASERPKINSVKECYQLLKRIMG